MQFRRYVYINFLDTLCRIREFIIKDEAQTALFKDPVRTAL